jgi:salicylate hydroxylase
VAASSACQAIEDAGALARAFQQRAGAGDADSVGSALRAYTEARIPRPARVQRVARIWGDIWHVDGLARMLRNELFRQRRPDDHRHIEWFYGQAA